MTLNLEVPSPLRAGHEVTAVCTGNDVSGSAVPTWFLNGVNITDGFTTTSEVFVENQADQVREYSGNTNCDCSTGSSTCPGFAVRLVGGSSENEGRVEIRCNGQWGTVCDDYWDINNAHVVCRQLGYSSASNYFRLAHFGEGSGPIWLDSIRCAGTEHSLLNCWRAYWGCHNCGHYEDAGVRCEETRNANVATYSVRSELTLDPNVAGHGGVLQCSLFSSRQSTLQVQYPIVGFRRGVLQRLLTTYVLLAIVFFLSLLTCAIVIIKRKERPLSSEN
ncbi:scavenger receptor cysteine-rich domain-containing protein DMBT1-like [Diadema setosum]|uniref:scavenger receptor cysteine-rich domain-containing protein DMBT1-like n=1 Tax=Diadema setosum TaxID=31175 RepID=UPI003B3B2B00